MSDDKKAAKAPTWTEFSDITTFHGIRYIPSTMRCRGYVKINLNLVISVIKSVDIFFSLQIQSARKHLFVTINTYIVKHGSENYYLAMLA